MYLSKWEPGEEELYYEASISIRKDLTPIFKVRIIPLIFRNVYSLVIRDYKTGIVFSKKDVPMVNKNSFIDNEEKKKNILKLINKSIRKIIWS